MFQYIIAVFSGNKKEQERLIDLKVADINSFIYWFRAEDRDDVTE